MRMIGKIFKTAEEAMIGVSTCGQGWARAPKSGLSVVKKLGENGEKIFTTFDKNGTFVKEVTGTSTGAKVRFANGKRMSIFRSADGNIWSRTLSEETTSGRLLSRETIHVEKANKSVDYAFEASLADNFYAQVNSNTIKGQTFYRGGCYRDNTSLGHNLLPTKEAKFNINNEANTPMEKLLASAHSHLSKFLG